VSALSDASVGPAVAVVPDLWALVKALRAFLDALCNVVDLLADLTTRFRAVSA
jgi:hypothetical protein